MTKRYSFPSEQIAKELILNLLLSESKLPFDKQTVTESTHGIACLGFQDKYIFNEETQENELEHKGLTYDVDIVWKNAPNENWTAYEVTPKTPNHNFK